MQKKNKLYEWTALCNGYLKKTYCEFLHVFTFSFKTSINFSLTFKNNMPFGHNIAYISNRINTSIIMPVWRCQKKCLLGNSNKNNSDAYAKPSQTFKMELLAKIPNS